MNAALGKGKNMTVSRFLVENNGSNPDSIKLAFSHAYQRCKAAGLSNITLVFPTKGSFISSDIAAFLGDQEAKSIAKGVPINLGTDIQLSFDIPRNIKLYDKYDVLLAVYLTGKDMDVIDGVRNVDSIVCLPWNKSEGTRWLSTWSPAIVGSASWTVSGESLPQAVQDTVLKLGRRINMSTGLAHPSDKDMAKKLFSELMKQGVSASPELIRQFAVQNGWEPVLAQELASFASKYVA